MVKVGDVRIKNFTLLIQDFSSIRFMVEGPILRESILKGNIIIQRGTANFSKKHTYTTSLMGEKNSTVK